MKYHDKDLAELQQISYKYSLYRTGDFNFADEISNEAIGIFLLKADTIEKGNLTGWIVNTSKNLIQSNYRTSKKEKRDIEKYQHDLLNRLNANVTEKKNSMINETFTEVLQTLDNDEMKTILLYFQCDEKLKLMNSLLDISYDALRKKISRIKRKLKAETFKKLGGIATKKIVTPQLNKLIIDFLKSFKTNLEANSLEKMYYYFSKIDLDNYNPTYEIAKIIDYEIHFTNSVYKVWIFYKNKNNNTDSFFIEFFVDEKNRLKIFTPPQKSKKVFKLSSDSEDGKKILQMLKNAKTDNKGISKFSSDDLEKILKQLNEK